MCVYVVTQSKKILHRVQHTVLYTHSLHALQLALYKIHKILFNVVPKLSYLVIVPHSNSNLLILVRVGCTYSVWTAGGFIRSVRARNIVQDVSRESFHRIAAWQESVTGTTSIICEVFTSHDTNSRAKNIRTGNASSPEKRTVLWKWVLTGAVLLWTVLCQWCNVTTGVRRVRATADTIRWVSLGYNKPCLKPLEEHGRINVLSYHEQLLCNVYIVALHPSHLVTWESHLGGRWAEIACTRWWQTLVQRIGTGGELVLSRRTATEVKLRCLYLTDMNRYTSIPVLQYSFVSTIVLRDNFRSLSMMKIVSKG